MVAAAFFPPFRGWGLLLARRHLVGFHFCGIFSGFFFLLSVIVSCFGLLSSFPIFVSRGPRRFSRIRCFPSRFVEW